MDFNSCARPTIGIEWELQLVDAVSLDLRNGILPLMECFPGTRNIKPEYVQSCVELTSGIAETSIGAVENLGQLLARIVGKCRQLGMRVIGAGTHPFCRRLAQITPTSRYLRIKRGAGYLARTQLVFSTHVHIGMKDGDEAIRVMSLLAPALPVFIALSANSPFWRGYQTGHAAFRHRMLATTRNCGLPVSTGDWSDFEEFYRAAQKSRTICHLRDIHWYVRPHPDFGTIEVRAMDSASNLEDLLALAAFVRTMVVCLTRTSRSELARVLPLDLPGWMMQQNCFVAGHRGLDAGYIHTTQGDRRPMRGLIEDLVDYCRPLADALYERHNLEQIPDILVNSPGYQRQVDALVGHSTRAVAEYLVQQISDTTHAVGAQRATA